MHDAELIAAVANDSDAAAFEELYRAHFTSVFDAAMGICHRNVIAEEIAQRALLTLWERAASLVGREVRVRPWLIAVARNASIDHMRSEGHVVPMSHAHEDVAEICDLENVAITNILTAELAGALSSLSPQQRGVIEMMYFEGLTFRAIADRTGDALGTVKSRVYLALGHLRREMCTGEGTGI